LTTATKPKRATKKKPDDLPATETPDVETAGGPESTDSPAREPLIARLAKLGFVVSDDDLTDAELVTAREWLDGKDFPATDVPEFLRDYEGVDAPLMQVALDAGKAKGQAGASENTCPYPPGTIMRAYWTDGFKDGMLAKEAARKADFESRKQLAIEDAQSRMESAVESQREYRKQWNHLKSRLKSVKQDYEDAVEEAQEAYEELQNARDGNLPAQRPLPFKDDKPSVPDQDIGGPAAPLPEDHGGKMDLNCLKKGEVQKQTGCRDDIGLSNKQIESLKEQIGGSTIAALEKFQREHQDWNRELDGFGEERITQLQDAHLEIRKTFPIPTAADAGPAEPPMTATEADSELEKLIAECETVADECDNDEGQSMAESVGSQATAMRRSIKDFGSVTTEQARAIRNWRHGIGNWLASIDDPSDVDELEDDLP
jgi:ribosome modulation factor